MKHLLLHTYEIHMYDIRKSPIHKNARLDTHHCGYDNGNSFLVFSYQRNLHICPYFFHSFIKRSDGLALSGALGVKEGIYGSDFFESPWFTILSLWRIWDVWCYWSYIYVA
jgi:hypothetical protein